MIFAAALLCLGLGACTQNKTKILVGGSGWDKIAIIDKASGEIEWTHPLEENEECNAVWVTDDGKILYSYKNGANLINRDGSTVWSFKTDSKSEVQHVSATPDGYTLAICGHPARIVNIGNDGEVASVIKFETGIENPHAQFRRIWNNGDGTYLVPLMAKGEIATINSDGEIIKTVKTEGGAFAVRITPCGKLLISEGDNHSFSMATMDGEVINRVSQNDIEGVNLGYVALLSILDNGNLMICNWLGHGADASQPHLIELDANNKVVWTYSDKSDPHMKISAAFEFTEKK